MRASLPLLLGAALVLPVPSAALYTKYDKVEVLDADTFDDVTESDALWLVEFYAPWCGHCQQLAPEWKAAAKALATEMPDEVKLGAVDCTRSNGVCQKYKVDGYPTLKVFGEDKDKPMEVSVGRTSADILTYVRGKLGKKAPPGGAGGEGAGSREDTKQGSGGGGSAALDDAWKTTEIPPLAATHIFTVAYAVALFAPKRVENLLSIHIVETAPNRVATNAFDWGPIGPLLRRVGHPCSNIVITILAPHLDNAMHNVTKTYSTADGCGVTARFWRNFADSSAVEQGAPAPDATVWLNVDAYMCPWRYSLLHSLSTGRPMVLSFFDEKPAKSLQNMLSKPDVFKASFGEEQRTKCDEMSGTLYGFKWLAHKVNHDWNLTETIDTRLIDVFLPVAPNQFTAKDEKAPRYTVSFTQNIKILQQKNEEILPLKKYMIWGDQDPTTLVSRPLELNQWMVGVWYDKSKQSAGLKSIGEKRAKKILMEDKHEADKQDL